MDFLFYLFNIELFKTFTNSRILTATIKYWTKSLATPSTIQTEKKTNHHGINQY